MLPLRRFYPLLLLLGLYCQTNRDSLVVVTATAVTLGITFAFIFAVTFAVAVIIIGRVFPNEIDSFQRSLSVRPWRRLLHFFFNFDLRNFVVFVHGLSFDCLRGPQRHVLFDILRWSQLQLQRLGYGLVALPLTAKTRSTLNLLLKKRFVHGGH